MAHELNSTFSEGSDGYYAAAGCTNESIEFQKMSNELAPSKVNTNTCYNLFNKQEQEIL